nr:MAG TPA: hypothetical protein [Caudoviricetes sp.]
MNILECSLLALVGRMPYCRGMTTREGQERTDMIYTSAAVAYRHLKFGWRQPGRFWNGIASLPEGGWPEVYRDTIHAYREGYDAFGLEHGITCAIEELDPWRMGLDAGLAVGDILRDEPLPMGIESLAERVSDTPAGLGLL